MIIEVRCYTVKELAEEHGMPVQEVLECYGEDCVELFFTSTEEDECPFVGVLCKDGSCNVYGLNADEEYVTFARMMERLVGYFVDEV